MLHNCVLYNILSYLSYQSIRLYQINMHIHKIEKNMINFAFLFAFLIKSDSKYDKYKRLTKLYKIYKYYIKYKNSNKEIIKLNIIIFEVKCIISKFLLQIFKIKYFQLYKYYNF